MWEFLGFCFGAQLNKRDYLKNYCILKDNGNKLMVFLVIFNRRRKINTERRMEILSQLICDLTINVTLHCHISSHSEKEKLRNRRCRHSYDL